MAKIAFGKEIVSEPSMATVPYKNPSHMDIKSEIAHVRFKTRNLNDMDIVLLNNSDHQSNNYIYPLRYYFLKL